jgi:hypothetical protein
MNGEEHAVLLRPIPQFLATVFNPEAGTITASIDGLIDAPVKIETSSNLNNWNFHSAHDLDESPVHVQIPNQSGATFLRVSRAP